jgi:hypothetical protein
VERQEVLVVVAAAAAGHGDSDDQCGEEQRCNFVVLGGSTGDVYTVTL